MTGGPLPGLSGLQVLDLSDDIAGSYCAKLLGDAGAQVTKVEGPEGHGLRQWSTSKSVGSDGDPDGVLFRFLASSQRSLVIDPESAEADQLYDDLAADSDVVIVSTVGDRGGPRTTAVDVWDLTRRHERLVVVSLSPFGLSGPRGGEHSSDLLLQALAGSLYSHGEDDREPLAVGGGMTEWTVGTFGAVGALSALDRPPAVRAGRSRRCVGTRVPGRHLHLLSLGRRQHARRPADPADLRDGSRHRTLSGRLRRDGDDHHGPMAHVP